MRRNCGGIGHPPPNVITFGRLVQSVLLRLADLNNNLAETNKTPGGMGG
jgi:hypothetical protein